MASSSSSIYLELHISQRHDKSNDAAPIPTATAKDDITLLWGINVIASVVGTVLAAISSMVIGFNGNLLIGLGLYLGALTSALFAARFANNTKSNQEVLT